MCEYPGTVRERIRAGKFRPGRTLQKHQYPILPLARELDRQKGVDTYISDVQRVADNTRGRPKSQYFTLCGQCSHPEDASVKNISNFLLYQN